jgi:3-oxoadipate enol-lactonase
VPPHDTALPDQLPLGRRVVLPGRGTTFVRELAGPPGAPVVVLLHGLLASAGLNWFQVMEPLSHRFHVIAPDLRGHGRGLRSKDRFTLADCADDVDALLSELEIERAVVVGYSMGGPVAQLLWRRHPDRVAGLVFCATSDRFAAGTRERVGMSAFTVAAITSTRAGGLITRFPAGWVQRRMPVVVRARPESFRAWAGEEFRRHDLRMMAEALHAVGTYRCGRWIHEVDVPTSVVLTTEDRAVPPREQLRLVAAIPGATVVRVEDGHTACAKRTFVLPLLEACVDVAQRAATAERSGRRGIAARVARIGRTRTGSRL